MNHLPGKFLKRKLSELNSALFYAEGESLFKLPNYLVTDMEMNDDGQIWFVAVKPAQDLEAFDKEFAVRLEFFKKGKPFRLKVQGKGAIVEGTERDNLLAESPVMQEKANNEPMIMIKVNVQFVDYAGNMNESFSDRLKLAGMQLSGWLFSSNVKSTAVSN